MKTMHLFAGIGGGLLADRILGHEPIIAVEWDKYCCDVLRRRVAEGWFPGMHVWEGDVRLFNPSQYTGRVDCIHAGFPCTDLSVAGKQTGLAGGTRSGLYSEVIRIAGTIRPRYIFMENVAAILRNEWLGAVLGDLAALGYSARWCCIRASSVGAIHHRDRWWLLAYTNSTQREGMCISGRVQTERTNTCIHGWWEAEPGVDRVVDGCPDRIHRLKGLGNAQVPLQAAVAWTLLGGPTG